MFKQLITTLCVVRGEKLYSLASKLGYKTASALQTVISGRDIRLSVLLNIIDVLGYKVIITDNKTINIDLLEYYKENKD